MEKVEQKKKIICYCLHNDGQYYIEYAYTPYSFPYDQIVNVGKTKHYARCVGTFDIETTNMLMDGEKTAYMYTWQFCLGGKVCIGRRWEELIYFLYNVEKQLHLNKDKKLVVYVHNLAFEFQFIYNWIVFNDIFASEPHKVIKCSNDILEFRCSYMLSNMNLSKFIENEPNTVHAKGVGDLDYRTIRTPDTPLKPIEYGYIFNDVMGLYEAINARLKDDSLEIIPLTSTGYVRRDARQSMKKNKKNRERFLNSALTESDYTMCKRAFRGGDTGSSRFYAGLFLKNVGSYDRASAYPFEMVSQEFPEKFYQYDCDSVEEVLDYCSHHHAVIGTYRFENIRIKPHVADAYISISRCDAYDRGGLFYNGRLLEADYIIITCTDIDLDVILRTYDYDNVYYSNLICARTRRLPDEYIEVIYDYFETKSKLKGDENHIYEYMKKKNKLNALFGMMVTSPIRDDILFNDGVFTTSVTSVSEGLERFYKSKNSFLPYQWGIYVTAYARKHLFEGIEACGIDTVYWDTDSVKFLGDHDHTFDVINNRINEYCLKNNIKNYVDVNGKRYYMGVFEKEKSYDEFITWGAKKYAYIQNGKIGVTVAGLNKKQGAEELTRTGGLSEFKLGKVFYNSGRTTATYNNSYIHNITVNSSTFSTASNIAIFDTTYELGITDTMAQILNL